MSLTVITQPQNFADHSLGQYNICQLSAGNDNYYTISGTTLFAPNVFEYRYIADVYINGVLQTTMKIFPDPTYGFGVFNTRNIIDNLLSFDYSPDAPSPASALFTTAPNSSARVVIQFGEQYISGATFTQSRNVISGNTTTYINSSLTFPTEVSPNLAGRAFAGGTVALSNLPQTSSFVSNPTNALANRNPMFTNQKQTLYLIGNDAARFPLVPFYGFYTSMDITTYNAAGTQINKFRVFNTVSGTTDVIRVDVSYASINSISASGSTVSVLSGSFPIFSANTAYYRVTFNLISKDFGTGVSTCTYVFAIQQDCGRFAGGAYNVQWLNEFGGFDSWLFNKKNETTQTKETQSFKRAPGSIQADGSYSLTTRSRNTQPYYTRTEDSILMSSDFLTDAQVLFLKPLFSSPIVFITDQNGVTTQVVVDDQSLRINKKVNQKIYSLQMTVKQSVDNFRQTL